MHSIIAVLFDLDGVLWDSNKAHSLAFEQVSQKYGLSLPPYESIAGKSTREIIDDLFPTLNSFERLKIVKEKQDLAREQLESIMLDDDLIKLLKLVRQKFRIGLVSSSSERNVGVFLSKLPKDFFEIIVCAEDVTHSKPHPEPYLRAMNLMSLSSDSLTIVEDSHYGFLSASAAGVAVLHVTQSCSEKQLVHNCFPNTVSALNHLIYS